MDKKKKLLIVGIDPGTTTAYACIDLRGNIIALGSSKEFKFESLLSRIFDIGTPVIAASDKANAPSLVRDFSVKTGSRLFTPKEDLLIREKQEIISRVSRPSYMNSHEFDALASAFYALRKNLPLIKKINFFIKRHDKADISFELAKLVITKRMQISLAAEQIEESMSKCDRFGLNNTSSLSEENAANAKALEEQLARERLTGLTTLIKRNYGLNEEVAILKTKNIELMTKIYELEKKYSFAEKKIENKVHKERVKQGMGFMEQNISALNRQIKLVNEEKDKLNSELQLLYSVIGNIDEFLVVKHMESLGNNALKGMNLKKDDIVYVKNPIEFSKNTIAQMKGVVSFIIAANAPSVVRNSFVVIDEKKLSLSRPSDKSIYYFCKKADFEKAVDAELLLDKVILDYKEGISAVGKH